MNRITVIIILTCIQIYSVFGQSDFDVNIKSKALEDEWKIKIHLPQDYSEDKFYPVIYITDANSDNFEIASNYIDMLSLPDYDVIPKCILVGITQKQRLTELDP
ncbi:MAG: hypothetical protein HWE15_14195 [Algoriphagus sp.]|uniref:alpha/beta hydrolase-fold protein n=1 Tax=Algoriphagus sp. TaxID=1872435 RepID=UPI0017F6EC61|nr:alpha/beta hydrolase-fold protein [Algoriphagus sp.]NVJ87456.1 hypothetical protein [Algoriphagus sp.]